MPGSDPIRRGLLVGALICAPAVLCAEAPKRVVSMNLCTDQLAMLLAAPGQLVSVSNLAADPRSSAMADQARGYASNQGRAEEVYLMQPDLVLAGTYTARASVAMLERLGVRVVTFDLTATLEDVPGQILHMGDLLGRPEQAAALAATYTADLKAFQAQVSRTPSAALYAANGYTTGLRSLSGQILLTAGFANVATEAGYAFGGMMPLEVLVMKAPEAVITSRPYPGATRAEAVMDHPALRAVQDSRARGTLADGDWVCGTPYVLRAVAEMAALRRRLTTGAP